MKKSINKTQKGKRGEVEFCEWLFNNAGIIVERTYNQASKDTPDIVLKGFIFEIKRRETLDLNAWWRQALRQRKKFSKKTIPVVAFRQNRKPWEFLIPASLVKGCKNLDSEDFIQVGQKVLLKLLRKSKALRL